MPKISERQALMKELNYVIKMMAMWDDDDTSEAEEISDICALLQSTRFINLREHVRKNKSMNEMLWHYGERDFKQIVRMKKDSFLRLLNLIADDPIFGLPDQRRKQCPVWVQVMVVFQRLGCKENGVSVGRCARLSGFSNGAVCKFTERVFQAILRFRKQVVRWPDELERQEISARMGAKFGLPGAVDFLPETNS